MKNIKLSIAILSFILSGRAWLPAATGGTALQSLNLRTTSRAEALGGAMTASGDDLSSLASNPATLSRMKYPEAVFSQAMLFQDMKFSYLAYAQPTRWGMPAFEYMNLSYGDFDNVDRSGQTVGTQSPKDSYFGFGWSTKHYKRSNTGDYSEHRTGGLKNFDVGVNARYFKSDLGSASASGLSLNLGTLYKTPLRGVSVGLAVNNLGSAVSYAGEAASQPRTVRMGFAYASNESMALSSKARFSLDGVLPKEGGVHMNLGAEIFFGSMVSFQAGYAGEENLDKRFRFGLGMGLDAVNLNYSAAPLGDLGTAHRITARMRFGTGVWNIMSILSGEQAMKDNIRIANQYIEMGDSPNATIYAHRVLKKQPKNLEANEILRGIEETERAKLGAQLYGEVVALIRLGLFMDAQEKLKQCLELEPSNKNYMSISENISLQIARDHRSETDKLLAKLREKEIRAPEPDQKQYVMLPGIPVPIPTLAAVIPAPRAPVSQNLDSDSKTEFSRAMVLLQEKRLDEAIGVLRSVAERNLRNESVNGNLANCLKGRGVKLFAKGKYEDSYTDFKEAAAINPADPSLKKFLANVEQIMESLNLKPTVASYRKLKK